MGNLKEQLEEREQNLKLEVARQLDEERKKIREDATKKISEEQRLKEADKDKQLADLHKQIEELKRKAEVIIKKVTELEGNIFTEIRTIQTMVKFSLPVSLCPSLLFPPLFAIFFPVLHPFFYDFVRTSQR